MIITIRSAISGHFPGRQEWINHSSGPAPHFLLHFRHQVNCRLDCQTSSDNAITITPSGPVDIPSLIN